MKTVKITANPTTGKVVTANTNLGKDGKQYGWFRVESIEHTFDGFARINKRSALVPGLLSDLEAMNLKAGVEVPGKIVIEESFEAKPGFQEVINPTTNQPLMVNGKQVYRKSSYTSDVNKADVRVARESVAVSTSAPELLA